MVLGSLGELEQRTPGNVPPLVDVGAGVHFEFQGNSQAHEGFVAATADVAFAAEFGAVAAVVAVSFVAAAARAVVAAAVAVAVSAVDAE